MRSSLLLCSCLLFFGCSPNSTQEFYREGEAKSKALVLDLKKIENHEQLLQVEPILKQHFESLIILMIQACEFQQKHPDDVIVDSSYEKKNASFQLEEQLRRIYSIEGGREVIERTQHEALARLDAYERFLAKKREQPITVP
jgi:hypothetical protein